VRYVSFFSGVEMASLAWQPLGWELVAVAEVDPFACAVLDHHHPDVPNLGDVSKITEDRIAELGFFDLIVMGFPCQDVSVAGTRKGLMNDDGTPTRTGLFFDAMRLVRAAHARCGTRWLVGENVPGLYSNNAGRDFGAVVGEIVGCTFDVPREGWQDTGAAAGPRGMVEWCCLDSQWRSLAQRRERVFFVADFGDWTDRSPILLERESLQGNPPTCVEARQRPAERTSGRSRRKGIWEQIADAFRPGLGIGPTQVAGALKGAHGRAGADASHAEAGQIIPETTGTIGGTSPGGGWRVGADEAAAGQLLPVVTPILEPTKRAGKKGEKKDGSGLGRPGDPMFTLQAGAQHGITVADYGGNDTSGPRDIASCLNAKGGASRMDFESETLIAHTLRGGGFDASEDGMGRGTPIIPVTAFSCKDDGRVATVDLSPTMRSMMFDKSHANAGGQLAIAFNARQDPDINEHVTHPLDTDGTSIGIAFDTTQITSGENRCAPRQGDPCHPLSATAHPPAYATRYDVRRLTPTECCRLQGVPDGHLDIIYRGRPAADGPKYKVLGNGFSVPVIAWIGERIESAMRDTDD